MNGLVNLVMLTGNNKSIGEILKNATSTLGNWGGILITLIGVILIIWGGVQIAKGFMAHGKGNTNWLVVILMIVVGGAFVAGGMSTLNLIGEMGQSSVEDLMNGSTTNTVLFNIFH